MLQMPCQAKLLVAKLGITAEALTVSATRPLLPADLRSVPEQQLSELLECKSGPRDDRQLLAASSLIVPLLGALITSPHALLFDGIRSWSTLAWQVIVLPRVLQSPSASTRRASTGFHLASTGFH